MKKIMELLQNMKAKNEKKDNKGFSLVELIIVIAIMAILVGIVGTQVLPYINKSKEAKDFQIINSYGTAATTAYSSDAENVTADTTIIVYSDKNKDEPAKSLETEIKTLTGYNTSDELKAKMGSKKGEKIKFVKVEISLTNKTITTQAYEDEACTTPIFDKVVTQL